MLAEEFLAVLEINDHYRVDVASNHGTYGITFLVYHFQLHDHSSSLDHCYIVDIIPKAEQAPWILSPQDPWIVYSVQDHFRDEKGQALVRPSDILKIRYQARVDQMKAHWTSPEFSYDSQSSDRYLSDDKTRVLMDDNPNRIISINILERESRDNA